jgi:hypothetical protein
MVELHICIDPRECSYCICEETKKTRIGWYYHMQTFGLTIEVAEIMI